MIVMKILLICLGFVMLLLACGAVWYGYYEWDREWFIRLIFFGFAIIFVIIGFTIILEELGVLH